MMAGLGAETNEKISPEAMYAINLLINDRISKREKIEQLKAYVYALADNKIRDEVDALDVLRSKLKKILVNHLLAAGVDSEFFDAALERFDSQFDEFYFRLIFIGFTKTELFIPKSPRNVANPSKMHESVCEKLTMFFNIYARDKKVLKAVQLLLLEYLRRLGDEEVYKKYEVSTQ